jgi:hypothetical protein
MWIANLSDGSVITEGPWKKLLINCKEKDIKITGLRLGVGGTLVTALSNKECDGYFQAYELITFMYHPENRRSRQGIGSVVGDKVYITWLEEGENRLIYATQDVRPLESCLVATTLA